MHWKVLRIVLISVYQKEYYPQEEDFSTALEMTEGFAPNG